MGKNIEKKLLNSIDTDVRIILMLNSCLIEEILNENNENKIIQANEKIKRAVKRYSYNIKELQEHLEKGEDK